MSEFYWQLTTFDGTELDIPPEAVDVVKRRMDQGQAIHTSSMTIPANQIKTFQQTSKPYGAQPLLEAAAQAFREPIISEDGSIDAKWVKKPVSQREYNKTYAAIPAYRKLGQEGSMVMVAFRLATHEIDLQKVDYLSEDELISLTRE